MGLFLQRCFDGLANGAIYASLAIALVIVYRSTGLLNVAQGEVATLGTYIGLVVHSPVTPALAGTGLAHALLPGLAVADLGVDHGRGRRRAHWSPPGPNG